MGRTPMSTVFPGWFAVSFRGIMELESVIEREHEAIFSWIWSIWYITNGWGSHVTWLEFHNKDSMVLQFKRSNYSDIVTLWLVSEGVSVWLMHYFLWIEVWQSLWWYIAWYSWLRHASDDDGRLHGYIDSDWEGSVVDKCDFCSTQHDKSIVYWSVVTSETGCHQSSTNE